MFEENVNGYYLTYDMFSDAFPYILESPLFSSVFGTEMFVSPQVVTMLGKHMEKFKKGGSASVSFLLAISQTPNMRNHIMFVPRYLNVVPVSVSGS